MNEKEEFSKRFNQMCKDAGAPENQTELAKWLAVSQPTVSDYKNGKIIPAMDKAIQIAKKLGCTVDWLLTGRGNKYPYAANDLLLDISKLSPEHRDIVRALVKTLESSPPKEAREIPVENYAQNKITIEPLLINKNSNSLMG